MMFNQGHENAHFIRFTEKDGEVVLYVAHEYGPAQGRDPIASLKQALGIFDV